MNKDLQFLAAGKGIRQWQIADQIGIAEETLSRWLRKELPNYKREMILKAINFLSKEES